MDDRTVNIELLVVPDCPHAAPAQNLLRQALTDVGLPGHALVICMVTDERQAAELGFTGSPTILIDGRDPFSEPGREPGLACRLYRSNSGTTSGVPSLTDMRRALKQAVDPGASQP